jgi:flagellar hook-basal body complex protein FliE
VIGEQAKMPTPILPVGNPVLPGLEVPASTAGRPGEFRSLLESSIEKMETLRSEANEAVENLINGQGGELHSVVLATQRADLAFELGLQIRNKVVQAYQEIMRMQM